MGRGRSGGYLAFGTKYAFKSPRRKTLKKKITVRIRRQIASQLKEMDCPIESIVHTIDRPLQELKRAKISSLSDLQCHELKD